MRAQDNLGLKTLEMLEFPKIREILAGFTSFSTSRSIVLELLPSSNADQVSIELARSSEGRRFLAVDPDFSVRGAADIREPARMAAVGKVLEPAVLQDVRTTLAISRQARSRLQKLSNDLPLLWEDVSKIADFRYIEDEIAGCISENGEVLDSASPELSMLRVQAKQLQQRLVERLEALMRSPRGSKAIQDFFITEREGRYVIPVKAECTHDIRGIVHDISNTGATVFIEPWSTVDLGNQLRQTVLEEKREVERILASLSANIGINEDFICGNVDMLAELDVVLAKARYAKQVDATEPEIVPVRESKVVRLINARHPLLGDRAVPLSVEIGGDYSVLVITGPNTGGKTVALKTIGLLTLMTQAGIPVSASEKSLIPVFDRVFTDIGDEQSIEQTLSSFSWHMGNIVDIIRSSTDRSLILLDELGTSTDPAEGSALARAILLDFLDRGNIVVATTHFGDLKVFAHSTPGLRNASLDFDPVTLLPTYHLTMGIPGGSNALAIAARLGLPTEIIDTARDMLGQGTKETESLLADLMREKKKLEDIRAEMENEQVRIEEVQKELEIRLQRLEEQERMALRETRDRLARESADLQAEIRNALADLKKARAQENVERAQRALAAARDEMQSLASRARSHPEESEQGGDKRDISVGDEVWLDDVESWATVTELDEEAHEMVVQIGQTRLRMDPDDVDKVRPGSGTVVSGLRILRQKSVPFSPPTELDLRGKRADEVAPELEKYLNDASLARLPRVRVIHGFGKGTVRQIVRDILASHPLVKSFKPGEQGEGGNGVTVATL